MSGTLNKVMLIGHLGDDVKIHRFDDGGCVGRFPLLRNKAAEICEKYLSKGDKVYIEGRIKNRKWQDDKGNDRYSTEINCTEFTFLSNKNDMPNQHDNTKSVPEPKSEEVEIRPETEPINEPDDLPF